MIRVDESDPVGEIEPSFPYRDVTVRRGVEFKDYYDIQSEIGRGKFGTVYRCKEKASGLMLAAKVVNTAKKEDRRAVEREVEIMRRLQHPRLIQLYDAIDTGKQIHVILELIEGGELFERVIDDDFVLTERSCTVFMRQICEGIEFIHRQNILHLDLKPENILCLTKEGNRIKIIDFGLAREYDPKKKLQVLFGTPEFVAPEVVNFDQIGFGTDMWSIGVICYVLLSGLSPFMGDTDIETMANVTIAKYDFDHDAFADISDDAKDFIRCLLVKDKEKRTSAAQCREHRWLAKKPSKQQVEQIISKSKSKIPQQIHEIPRLETSNAEELDVAKDNLRLFVERWREHPNSPYMLDIPPYNFLQNSTKDHDDRVSLKGHSPSPCASICSTPSESADNSPRGSYGSFLTVPGFGFERRASEGIATEKSRGDPASQIILAEEIIKLSAHLRSIAMGTCIKSNDEDVRSLDSQEKKTEKPEEKSARNGVHSKSNVLMSAENSDCNEITEKLTSIMRHRKLNGTTFHSSSRNFEKYTETNSGNIFASLKKQKQNADERSCSRKEQDRTSEETATSSVRSQSVQEKVESTTREKNVPLSADGEMDLTPPWRRSRMKRLFGETSRDVPRISELRNLHKSLNLDEPTNTKDLLLHLLEEWDGVATRSSGVGRKSVSVDWCGEESVGRKTMNSLAEYFQAKQQKSTASSVNSTAQNSVHR
ncbi:calcium/calmodulin-dependent protein kinase I-like isoform X2 [Osmia bicornis bicornis]|uniref:calcium/calmodulin-dependent protein kinase I-like isoform X2 n=1 Tax=Osmia bicornis bicornis TaxID=1437191 RepID=UPI001EAEA7C1|nr:calcium/calmodulin-dependent protein kinase I-like isoform X2 [Osmia bicornis bicornis]